MVYNYICLVLNLLHLFSYDCALCECSWQMLLLFLRCFCFFKSFYYNEVYFMSLFRITFLYSVLWIVTSMFIVLIFMFLALRCIPHLISSTGLILKCNLWTFLNLWFWSVLSTHVSHVICSGSPFCMGVAAFLLSRFIL